jgi:hypothetical protein
MDAPIAWAAEDLTDDSREAFYAAARQHQAAAERADRSNSRLWQIVGCAGVVIGLIGMGAAFDAIHHAPMQQPPGYVVMDKTTGWISQPMTALDAPQAFSEIIRERAIRGFLYACQSYIPETWWTQDYHACMLMATPAEQKRLAAEIGTSDAPDYPPTLFPRGYANIASGPQFEIHDQNLGSTGNPPNVTWSYEVRYTRTEVVNGQEAQVPYTARIALQFHPELKMSRSDREINPAGVQVVSFSTVKD